MTPHPRTVQSIELQGSPCQQGRVDVFECGCEHWPPTWKLRWRLCAYHRGYDDALTADVSNTAACTGITATWCPECGDCTCPKDDPFGIEFLDSEGCPLHGSGSQHAEGEVEL